MSSYTVVNNTEKVYLSRLLKVIYPTCLPMLFLLGNNSKPSKSRLIVKNTVLMKVIVKTLGTVEMMVTGENVLTYLRMNVQKVSSVNGLL